MATVVLDNGSCTIKAGLCGGDNMMNIFPSIIGSPHILRDSAAQCSTEYYVGHEAQKRRDILNISYPIIDGVITDWDNMEKIWRHVFYDQLTIEPEEYPVLLTEPLLNPKSQQERMAQMMFETFRTPSLYVGTQGLLAIYAPGRTTGVVLDCGHGVCQIVPVYEGYPITEGIQRINLAGSELTGYLAKLLKAQGYSFETLVEQELVQKIKETHCYVAIDYKKELEATTMTSAINRSYSLSDCKDLILKHERFLCPEALFQPSLMGEMGLGLHQHLHNSIMECGVDSRRDLHCNVILSGGTTMIPGFVERMRKGLQQLAPSSINVKCVAPPDRQFSVWNGGALLSSLPSFQQLLISKEEYYEWGPTVIHHRDPHS